MKNRLLILLLAMILIVAIATGCSNFNDPNVIGINIERDGNLGKIYQPEDSDG